MNRFVLLFLDTQIECIFLLVADYKTILPSVHLNGSIYTHILYGETGDIEEKRETGRETEIKEDRKESFCLCT